MPASAFGRQFEVVFEHSPIGIIIMEASGRIQYANESVRTFLERESADLSGSFLTDFSHPEDAEFFQSLFEELLDQERDEFQVVSRCVTGSNRDAWWRVDIRAVRGAEQAPFILAVVDDVTLQKNDEYQLRKAKELAESATRTKSAFLANMSHEIRTPLHTINGMAELLRETQIDAEQMEYLQQIQFAGEVLLGLINDILDFSKIEAGRFQVERITYDPVRTIEDAVDLVSLQAHKKGLEMILTVDQKLPRTMNGDPNRLRQVIVNLVNNAVKFTEAGHVKVSARRRDTRDGAQVLVQVKDTGIGIPEDRQSQLFEPFSQVDASMTRKFGGTGLGLSISHDLVELMNGRMGVKSKPGVGSNFWFQLPVEGGSEETIALGPPAGMPAGIRVLVVDEYDESADVVSAYLERWGAQVDRCHSARSAIDRLTRAVVESDGYDLALIDLRLPDMDGWQMASEVRNDPVLDATRLILVSPSGTSTGDAKMKLLRWFDAYINKPVKLGEIADGVAKVYASDIEELEAIDFAGENTSVEDADDYVVPKTVLVAEDHFVNQQLFQTILAKLGFTSLVASDGLEAVEAVQKHPEIGLIFMDVQMPNMNGYDATTKIRELGSTTPIVAVTANALAGDRERCMRVGMNEYMSKPFRRQDVEDAIRRLGISGAFQEETEDVDQDDADTSGEVPIDMEAALEAFMGDAETVQRVVKKFAGGLLGQLDDLARLLADGNAADARVLSHAIKGGAWNLAAQDLGDAAKVVEDACASDDIPTAQGGLEALRVQIVRLAGYVGNFDYSTLA